MLSSNQAALLRRLADSSEPVMLSVIAGWSLNGHGEYGENAARNALKRMQDRGLVAGSGAGRTRSYVATPVGRSALAEHAGAPPADDPPPTPDSGPASATRNYIVLERVALEDFEAWLEVQQEHGVQVEEVLVQVAFVDARNTEHALRLAANDYPDIDADPLLIPVAERMWQPETVQIRNKRSITIGA